MDAVHFQTRQTLTITVGLLLLLFTIAHVIIFATSEHQNRTISVAGAGGTLFLSLLLLTDDITVVINEWFPQMNLGWFLGYILGMFGCYQFGCIICNTDMHSNGERIRRGLRLGFIFIIAILSFIYIEVMLGTPLWIARTPRNLPEYLFSSLYFAYCLLISLLAIGTMWLAIGREKNIAQRLRLQVTQLGAIASFSCFANKLIYLTLFVLEQDLIWLNHLALYSMAIAGFLLPIALMPGWLFRHLIRYSPWLYLRQLWDLFWLVRLLRRIQWLLPDLVVRQFSRFYDLTNTRLSIYRAMIAILDGKKILADWFSSDFARQGRAIGASWTDEQRQVATALHNALSTISSESVDGHDHTIHELVSISKRIG